MPKNTPKAQPSKDDELLKRVDTMMDAEQAAPDAAVGDDKPAIDIFKETKTAPEVSAKVLKGLSVPVKVRTKPAEKPKAEPELAPVDVKDDAVAEPVDADEALPGLAPIPADGDEDVEPTKAEPTEFNDPKTNHAVDKIIAAEGDTVLEAEDNARKPVLAKKPTGKGWKQRLANLGKKKLAAIIVALVVLVVFAVPFTRYSLLGLVITKQVTISVVDSKTATPVSSAEVVLHGVTAKTDGEGKVTIKAPLGSSNLTVTKQYYTEATQKYFVGFKAATAQKISLVATGRQVPITVLNSVTSKPVVGATVKILDTTAKTNTNGLATIVLPAGSATKSAVISLDGYNSSTVTATVTDKTVATNSFKLTPAGKVYFLSNSAGTIDVVKANLDGSDRKTVLTGTGKEDSRTTSLLASRDWKYVVLQSRRDTAQPSLYIIDTTTDKAVPFESGDNTIQPIGWYNHNFVYDVVRNSAARNQSGREILKSYNAETNAPSQLDQNQAEGDAYNYGYQSFENFYILDGLVSYTSQWLNYGSGFDLSGKSNTIRGVQPGGQNKKDYHSFPAGSTSFGGARLYEPQGVYFLVYSNGDSKYTHSYYHFENQSVTEDTSIADDEFNKEYPTFLLSPSGSQTFWAELRDGKNALFTGGPNADGKKQIATLSEYKPYGWYGNTYVLVSKGDSELYILPVTGLKDGQAPLKITNYYKPAQTFAGYGYGYGGL